METSLHSIHAAPQRMPLVPPPREEREPTFADYLATLADGRWTVAAAIGVALLCGAVYFALATPVYRADSAVQVEEKTKGVLAALEDIRTIGASPRPDETEIEILRSRMLVGSVVDQLRLDIVAYPQYFPIVGAAVARWRHARAPMAPILGLDSFAWGGERIDVTRLDVPATLDDTPLTVVALRGGRFELRGPTGILVQGEIGKSAEAMTDNGERVGIFLRELVAREGTRFRVMKRTRAETIKALQDDLVIAQQGRRTGIIRISLMGPDPVRITGILDALQNAYVRQNVERKSAEAEKTLEFINAQLPILKSNVYGAETALTEYRQMQRGAMDMSLETKAMLDRVSEVEKQATELSLQKAELAQRFTPNHPALESVRRKEASVEAERAAISTAMKKLPESELNLVRLQRNVKVANELYVLLLNKAQELKVLRSGTIGNVRILDPPESPKKPTSPRGITTLLVSVLMGLVGGIGLVFCRKALSLSLEDPDDIERETGLPVYAIIPHSYVQARNSAKLHKRGSTVPLLAATDPSDLAIESLRSLRTSVQFALSESRNNVVAIGGPSPAIGKSFVAANLAHVFAEGGKRVVVVDADIRRGRLHQYFGAKKSPGLSEVIHGTATLDEALRPTALQSLMFLPMGEVAPNPAELLGSHQFTHIVGELSSRFDLVLLDNSPVLAVTDPVLVGRTAGLRLLLLRARHHAASEITAAVKRMAQNGVPPHSIVINDAQPRTRYGKDGGGYHQYVYK